MSFASSNWKQEHFLNSRDSTALSLHKPETLTVTTYILEEETECLVVAPTLPGLIVSPRLEGQ